MSKRATAASSSSFRRKPELGGFALLSDPTKFQTLNGLWKGKKGPLVHATVIRNTNFTNDGQLNLTNVAALDVEAKQLATRALQRHDIILERSGGGPKQPVGRVCLFDAIGDLPFSFSNFTSVIRIVDQRRLLPRYVHYFLLHLYKDGYTENLQHATTGIRNLNFSSYLDTAIPVISKPEQEKIAAVLWKVQRAIATQDRLIAATRDLKASAMRRLFTHGLRNEPLKDTEIGPMPESWELVRLGDAYESQLGKMLSQKARVGESPKPYLRNKNVQWGYLDLSDLLRMDFDEREARKFKLEPGDLLVCEGGVIGRAAIWSGELKECYYQKALHRIRPRNDLATNEFLCYWLSFSFEHQNLYSIGGASSTIAHIPQVLLEGLKIPRPDKSEQRAIADTLATIDRKLTHHQKKRAALNDLFQTLLHKLMTAEIRVNHLDIDTSEIRKC